MARVGYVFDPLYLEHRAPGHPERPERLEAILGHLRRHGLLDELVAILSLIHI